MKKFFKDYANMTKNQVNFIKEHPVGFTAIIAGSAVVGGVIGYVRYKREARRYDTAMSYFRTNKDFKEDEA